MMRQSFSFCGGHAAGPTAVRGSRAAGLATAPGTHSRCPGKECSANGRGARAPPSLVWRWGRPNTSAVLRCRTAA
eukprot:2877618-Pyramimonas_sp.AAC.1